MDFGRQAGVRTHGLTRCGVCGVLVVATSLAPRGTALEAPNKRGTAAPALPCPGALPSGHGRARMPLMQGTMQGTAAPALPFPGPLREPPLLAGTGRARSCCNAGYLNLQTFLAEHFSGLKDRLGHVFTPCIRTASQILIKLSKHF